MITLGDKIREARRAKGWTQKELAAKLKMTTAQISRWEHNHVVPRSSNLQDLVKVFDVSPEEFEHLIPSASIQLVEEDPEMFEFVTQINVLNPEQRKALKLVLNSMVTCQRLQDLAGASA